jgi:uncharacterized coiled-coil protein SlyX
MATLEDRISFVEGRVMEQSNVFAALRSTLTGLDSRMTALETRVSDMESRLDGRIDSLEHRMDARFEQLDHKLDQRFGWLIGLQITTILAFVGSVIAVVQK